MSTEAVSILSEADYVQLGTFLGYLDNLPAEQYHAAKDYLSNSGLKKLAVSPKKFQAFNLGLLQKDETASQRLGTLTHMAVLEPELFVKCVVKFENFRSKANQEAAAQAEKVGKYACTVKEYDLANAMAAAVLSHPDVGYLFKSGVSERSCFAQDPQTGVKLKARLDKFYPDRGIILDLKTFDFDSDSDIERQMRRMKYDWQTYFYSMVAELAHPGVKVVSFANVFVETEPGFDVTAIVIKPEDLARAENEVRHMLNIYAECLHNDRWPGISDRILEVSLPPF